MAQSRKIKADPESTPLKTLLAPLHVAELAEQWEQQPNRIPTAASRRLWALARGLRPDKVNAWWYHQKRLAKKTRQKVQSDAYELPVGDPPISVKTEPYAGSSDTLVASSSPLPPSSPLPATPAPSLHPSPSPRTPSPFCCPSLPCPLCKPSSSPRSAVGLPLYASGVLSLPLDDDSLSMMQLSAIPFLSRSPDLILSSRVPVLDAHFYDDSDLDAYTYRDWTWPHYQDPSAT